MKALRILAVACLVLLLAGTARAQYSPPTNLSAWAISGSQISMTWTPSWEFNLVGVYRWTAGSGTTLVTITYSTSFTDSGLASGTTYYYCAKTFNYDEGGYYPNSDCSNTAAATTWAPPAAPSGLGATFVGGTQINLGWSDNSGNETGFNIYRAPQGGSHAYIATVGANVTGYADTGLSPGVTYYYFVRAANSIGESGNSNEVAAYVIPSPAAPSGLSGNPASSTQINLAWTDNAGNETAFKLERKTGAGGSYGQIATPGANATSYSDTSVTAGNVYYYRIRATNSGGDSGYSNETSVSFVVPTAPSGLGAADLANGNVRLAWTDNSNSETNFKLERKPAGGSFSQIATPAANATSYDDSGLTAGIVYTYRIRASGIPGDSAYSNEVSIQATAPNVTTGTVTYTYDPFGNLVQTNAGGAVTTLEYDLRGRKTKMTDPDMGVWTYKYNALGELVWQCDPNSRAVASTGTPADCTDAVATQMEYDKLGRMTKRTERDLVSRWSYDAYPTTSVDPNWDSGLLTGLSGSCAKGVGKLCFASADNDYKRLATYDSLGRASELKVNVDTTHTTSTTYDSSGRLDTLSYPTGFAVKHVYNAYGHLQKVQTPDAATIFWQGTAQNAAGGFTSETLGNGLGVSRTYDTLFRLSAVSASGTGGTPHSQSFAYDPIGNLTQRVDVTQSVTESFAYDTLNRLISSSGSAVTTRVFDYDAIGNISYRSSVGAYSYGSRPHAVASVSGSGNADTVSASYTYDANGNLSGASGTIYPASTPSVAFSRSLSYMSFNAPNVMTHVQGGSTYSYTYTYNAEHERVKLVTVRPTDGTHTSIYVHPAGKGALLYEKEVHQSSGLTEHKHYVNGGSGLVGVYVTTEGSGAPSPEMRYYHKDHLGSVAVITNPAGAKIGPTLAYEAFGERRYPDGTSQDRSSPINGDVTDRGFTAHEHLDEMMLIHMNGRIYDPVLARFMTPDPFVQAPENLQSYNRYSYGFNNPLSGVDPSGYGFIEDVLDIADAFIEGGGVFIVASWWLMGPGGLQEFGIFGKGFEIFSAATAGATGGFMSSDGSLRGTLTGAISGALFNWASGVGPSNFSPERIAAHALAGCISGAVSKAGCGSQALGAGVAKFVSAGLGEMGLKSGPGGFVAAIVSGGVGSKFGGGKFDNGAVTAAFGYLFNYLAHEGSPEEVARMKKDQATLRQRSPYAASIIEAVENDKTTTVRMRITAGGNAYDPVDKVIYYNPDKTHIYDGSQAWHHRPPEVGMGHELVHSYHQLTGALGKTVNLEEANTVVKENKIRTDYGIPLRPHY